MITADDVRQMVSFVQRLLFVYLPLVAGVCLLLAASRQRP